MSLLVEQYLAESLTAITSNAMYPTDHVVKKLMQDVVAAYAGRPYHNITHIETMLGDLFRHTKYTTRNAPELVLAIIYHDFVYELAANDNELKSSERFREAAEQLNIPNRTITDVFVRIMATRHPLSRRDIYLQQSPFTGRLNIATGGLYSLHHEEDSDIEDQCAVIHDLDLLAFSLPYNQFRDINSLVEKEYVQAYSSSTVRRGRMKFLQEFYKNPLYHYPIFDKFNLIAKDNIKNLLQEYEDELVGLLNEKISSTTTHNIDKNIFLKNE